MPEPHLWEIDHPYYCAEGNFFKAGQHTRFESWADFTEETYYSGDRDLNLVFRWDWHRSDDGPDELLLFFVFQRKAWLCSVGIAVTEADEPAVREFLESCARTMAATWEPLNLTREAASRG
jgi:hypothetical protein